MKLVPGMKVRYLAQPEWGVGHLLSLAEDGTKAEVQFPSREGGAIFVSTKQGQLVAQPLAPGDRVRLPRGEVGAVAGEVEGGRGLRRYLVKLESTGEESEWPESELRVLSQEPDLVAMLKAGQVAQAQGFLLRKKALLLDDERRCDALGALLASRVMVKPHQVGVVQRVLSARRPRFILADEVGLGKTIEAGMVFSALRLAGLAKRVLVVAPSHLTVQWLAELFHKFNQLFTLMDGERYAAASKEQLGLSPWSRFDKVVTSLELLSRSEQHWREAAESGAYWDLVIIDEAHHLKGEKAFRAAGALAKNCWGLLLLTATPMQLDPEEYHSLLTLIEPSTAPTREQFRARLSRQEELSQAVRALLEAPDSRGGGRAVAQLAGRFPRDLKLRALKERSALLSHLAETYSLSDRLIRNRRAVVGGFSPRRLHRHLVELPAAELQARQEAIAALGEQGGLFGAALAGLLRRLESSPAAFVQAVKGTRALAGMSFRLPERDAKLLAFTGVLRQIWSAEAGAKVLVFTESRETLESLRGKLGEGGVEALAYHGEMPLLDRDRQVARFRDPEGPRVLLCTEVGGEGRNFQFAHHLVNYDLPWSPAMMEQRIGRLDRIGQTRPVEIHVFEVPHTLSADLLSILADSVGVFGETVGGLDAVLEEVEPRLTELALALPAERAAYAQELSAKVSAARLSVRRAYDPLLDLRSFDREAAELLVKKARGRFALSEEEPSENIEEGLWSLARDLDERLEEAVTELARKVGLGVDTDEQVEAFQVAFHFGHELKVEALPGISLGQDKVVLGTFWRDTAVEQEEIDYFATGHPIVEALFGFLRDGPYGRNGARLIERRGGPRSRGLELLFHLHTPEPEDTSPGAKVPSRQLSRFLDQLLVHLAVVEGPGGVPRVDSGLLPLLEEEGRPLIGEKLRAAFPSLGELVEPALAAGTRAAEAELKRRAETARRAIEAERELCLERMRLSLLHQGVEAEALERQLEEERLHYQKLLLALNGLRVVLDSACAFVTASS